MRKNVKYYCAAAVALLTFLVYLKALQNDFVTWDDDVYVFQNPHILSLNLTFLSWAFFDFYSYNWHPLTWMSHAVDYALWGLNPLGHHLTNIVFHAVNALLATLLMVRLLEVWRGNMPRNELPSFMNERAILIAAGTTGLLFGLHPVHVESVAWVSERKDLLCALFFLLSVMAYVRYADNVSDKAHRAERIGSTPCAMRFAFFTNKHYLISLGFFVLALLSKPMAVSLPVVLLILDWHPFDRIRTWKTLRPALFEKMPLITLSLGSSIVTVLAQRAGGALISTEEVSLSERLLVAVRSLMVYLENMVWPRNLAAFYPYPRNISLLSVEYLSAIILVIGITAACLVYRKKRKVWLSVWGYFVVTLIPVLGIVQVGGQSMADRYLYLPSLGPFLLVGLGSAWMWGTAGNLKKRGPTLKLICGAMTAFAFAFLIYATLEQIGIWKNGFVLWNDVIEKQPDRVPVAYNNRGIAFMKMGRLDKAVEDFNAAIALDPSDYLAYANLGKLYLNIGSFEKSIEYAGKAIVLAPLQPVPYNNRGISYHYTRRYDGALQDFNKAIELDRDYANAYFNRGNLYRSMDRKELAVADYQKACDLGHENACRALYQAAGGSNSTGR
jgi:tetratricopeptide (TPR) repeat protein